MTAEEKAKILAQISLLLDNVTDEPPPQEDTHEPVEMLTIKECANVVKGLSEHTIRLLVSRGEIASIRTGAGKTGKILIPKDSLLAYLDKIREK